MVKGRSLLNPFKLQRCLVFDQEILLDDFRFLQLSHYDNRNGESCKTEGLE